MVVMRFRDVAQLLPVDSGLPFQRIGFPDSLPGSFYSKKPCFLRISINCLVLAYFSIFWVNRTLWNSIMSRRQWEHRAGTATDNKIAPISQSKKFTEKIIQPGQGSGAKSTYLWLFIKYNQGNTNRKGWFRNSCPAHCWLVVSCLWQVWFGEGHSGGQRLKMRSHDL